MRVFKLTLATIAAVIVFGGSAYAVEVKKKIAAPGGPEDIWEMISDFCSIKEWHPAVAQCDETEEGDETFRVLTLKDGGKIKERLLEADEDSYSYEIVESPLPVKNYQARLWVEQDERQPDRTVIHWEAEFDANGASDEEAAKTIGGIFTAGLKGIKQMALPPEDDGQEDKD